LKQQMEVRDCTSLFFFAAPVKLVRVLFGIFL